MTTVLNLFSSRRNQVVAVVLGLLAIAGSAFTLLKPSPADTDTVRTVPVIRGGIIWSVASTGKVIPNFEVEIKGKASGKIIHLPFDVSDTVREGDLLVQLDPIDESRQVSQASASLAGVESRMDQTRLNLQVARQSLGTDILRATADLKAAEIAAKEADRKQQRLESLVKNRYISQEEYEAGQTQAVRISSQLENAKVRLRELQTQEIALKAQAEELNIAGAEARAQRVALATSRQRLSETRIYAPISGVVTSRAGQIGQIVASGISNVGGGTAIMTLADLSRIFVLASVDESDIGRIREGLPVEITADAFPGEVFRGKVVRISPKGVEESNVVTFEVKIEVTGVNKQLLKPEMTANVEILIARKDNVVLVPSETVLRKDGKPLVRVLDERGKTVARPVMLGINNGAQTEIIQGLKPGERVVNGQIGNSPASRWKKEDRGQGGLGNRRTQRAMMRGFGGR